MYLIPHKQKSPGLTPDQYSQQDIDTKSNQRGDEPGPHVLHASAVFPLPLSERAIPACTGGSGSFFILVLPGIGLIATVGLRIVNFIGGGAGTARRSGIGTSGRAQQQRHRQQDREATQGAVRDCNLFHSPSKLLKFNIKSEQIFSTRVSKNS
jgi:hypothetical protein